MSDIVTMPKLDWQNILDSVRSKTGKTDLLVSGDVSAEIDGIESIDTSDATASASDILGGKTAYIDGEKVTGSFTIDSELSTQDDLIAQIQSTVDSLPEASGDPVLQNKTVTPSASSQTITADSGYDGLNTVTVTGDNNLVAENIAEGVSIFGVTGTHSGGGGGSVETCTVEFKCVAESTPMPPTLNSYIVTRSVSGAVISEFVQDVNSSGTHSVSDVVCGSTIIIVSADSGSITGLVNCEHIIGSFIMGYPVIRVTAGNGDVATITIG